MLDTQQLHRQLSDELPNVDALNCNNLVESCKLYPDDISSMDSFGNSVAISSDGSRVIIGAYLANVGDNNSCGAAYIFRKVDDRWVQEAKLTATDKVCSSLFGNSVTIDNDGSTVAIGARKCHSNDTIYTGAVYIFTRAGTEWSEEAKIVPTGACPNVNFGSSVSLNGVGDIVAIGSPSESSQNNDYPGAAYVYIKNDKFWIQQDKFKPIDDNVAYNYGYCVSISNDGQMIAVGSPNSSIYDVKECGMVYVYRLVNGEWTIMSKMVNENPETCSSFGYSLALDYTGSRLVIGAYRASLSGIDNCGSVYVFSNLGNSWFQEARLNANDASKEDRFGSSVTVNHDASIVATGAYLSDADGKLNSDEGAAYIFVRIDTIWLQKTKLIASDRCHDDQFASSLALSCDGSSVVIGASFSDSAELINSGGAYIFD